MGTNATLTARAAAIMGSLTLPQWNALRHYTGGRFPAPRETILLSLVHDEVLEIDGDVTRLTDLGYEVCYQAGFFIRFSFLAHVLQTESQRQRMATDPRERALGYLAVKVKSAIESGDFPPAMTTEGFSIPQAYGRMFLRDGVVHLIQDGILHLISADTVRAWAFRYSVQLPE